MLSSERGTNAAPEPSVWSEGLERSRSPCLDRCRRYVRAPLGSPPSPRWPPGQKAQKGWQPFAEPSPDRPSDRPASQPSPRKPLPFQGDQ
jgi:hypothetical protein